MALHPPSGLAAGRWQPSPAVVQAITRHHRSPPVADSTTEIVFLAERADLAAVGGMPLSPDAVWADGARTLDRSVLGALSPA